jgi:hypothetical protein
MRTTFAAEPRSFDWHFSFNLKSYTAQPFPPVAWRHVPSSGTPVVKWCEAVHLTWITKDETNAKGP